MTRELIASMVLTSVVWVAGSATAAAANPDWSHCVSEQAETTAPKIDPLCFFDCLIDRYRRLTIYADVAQLVQVTKRADESPKRVETQIECEIGDGKLHVETPGGQLRRGAGLDLKYAQSPALQEARLKYDLWLAPHMSLKFTEEPKRDFRAGVEEGFTATEAESVVIDDREMVHLELKSGDGQSEDAEAVFNLFVNPDSMLIERIEGHERLPDGASLETTLDITPAYSDTADPPGPAVEEAPAVTDPAPAPAEAPPVRPDVVDPGLRQSIDL